MMIFMLSSQSYCNARVDNDDYIVHLTAEDHGKLIPRKSIVIEPTSDNTGVTVLSTLFVHVC